MLQVSEQFAGQVLKCEHCGAPYSVPVLPQAPALSSAGAHTSPAASPPPPTPGPTSSIPTETYRFSASEPPRAGTPPPPPPPPLDGIPLPQPVAGYQRVYSLWIKHHVVKWIPPVALALVFALLFFTWIIVPGRPSPEMPSNWLSLTGWQTGFGAHYNGFGLVFAIAFLFSLVAAVAGVVLPHTPPDRLHPRLNEMLPWRAAIVLGLTGFACLFLVLEMVGGFGPDHEPSFSTPWFRLAVLIEIIALAAAALDWWLTLRGPSHSPPRIDVSW